MSRKTPEQPKRRGQPAGKALRWNLQLASREFGVNRETLERRRRAEAMEPGEDGMFSTAQILVLVSGDGQARAHLEWTRAKAEHERVQTEILRGERPHILDVRELLDELIANLSGILKSYRSKLPDEVFQDLFSELRGSKAKIPKAP